MIKQKIKIRVGFAEYIDLVMMFTSIMFFYLFTFTPKNTLLIFCVVPFLYAFIMFILGITINKLNDTIDYIELKENKK